MELTKNADNELKKLPIHIIAKLLTWVVAVEKQGLPLVRVSVGLHDEALRGVRKGQCSIMLSKAYRAFYTTSETGKITIVEVFSVNKHDY